MVDPITIAVVSGASASVLFLLHRVGSWLWARAKDAYYYRVAHPLDRSADSASVREEFRVAATTARVRSMAVVRCNGVWTVLPAPGVWIPYHGGWAQAFYGPDLEIDQVVTLRHSAPLLFGQWTADGQRVTSDQHPPK